MMNELNHWLIIKASETSNEKKKETKSCQTNQSNLKAIIINESSFHSKGI